MDKLINVDLDRKYKVNISRELCTFVFQNNNSILYTTPDRHHLFLDSSFTTVVAEATSSALHVRENES